MNDKIIINTISKIHLTIVSLLLFIFLTLSIIFISLQNGIYIENISIPNLKIEALYIKWNEKLNISIKEINLSRKQKNNDSKIDYNKLNNYLKKIYLFDTWFEKIIINKITYNSLIASFKYKCDEKSYFKASSPDFSLNGEIFSKNKLLNIKIKKFNLLNKNITIDGNLVIDSLKLEAITSLNLNINNEISLKLLAQSNKNKLIYKIISNKKIKTINYLIDLIGINNKLRYWIIDAIDMQNLSINQFYGWVDYNHINQAYKNIYTHATIEKLHYKYDKKLDAIHTQTTDLEFKNGILYIYPRKAYTYGFYLNKSWLKIDFTKKNIFLTLKLKFDAMLNDDILYLLNRYNIKLPFLQKKGSIFTNLEIIVNLNKIAVTAHGNFYTKKANFDYLGLNLDIFDTKIYLDNYDVKINDMLIKYKDIATTKVNVKLDTKNHNGLINFDVKNINFKHQELDLLEPINIIYNISDKQDTIDVTSSLWKFKNETFNLESLKIPFYLKKLSLKIPSTLIESRDIGSAYISGNSSFKNKTLNLDIDVIDFSYKNINLLDKHTVFKLLYQNSNIDIKSTNKINLTLLDQISTLNKLSLNIKDNILNINSATLKLKDSLSTSITTNYNMNENNGEINLYDLEIRNKKIGSIFYAKEETKLNMKYINDTVYIRAKKFDLNFISSEKYWKLNTRNLCAISKKSDLLQKYFIDNGNFNLIKYTDENKINFTAKTNYKYKLILIDDKLTSNYKVDGYYNLKTNNILFSINNKINVNLDKVIKIKTSDIGINTKEIINLLEDINKSKESSSTKITLDANNSYLYINKNRKVLSDKINIEYFDSYTTANLTHQQGNANFILEKNSFSLYGNNFNDTFIEKLFSNSKFKDGKLDFYIGGDLKNYSGLFHIQDTTILEYKLLNNILAFVNTIPSLITFSLPGYNNHGLAVKNAYIDFKTEDGDKFNIDNVLLDSKEIKIVGKGIADFKENSINMKLNLKTDLGSTIAKIPVVGYLVLGNDTISSSLEIHGKLDDPKVRTRLANDIVVAPLNIIKRTLLLPAHLIKK